MAYPAMQQQGGWGAPQGQFPPQQGYGGPPQGGQWGAPQGYPSGGPQGYPSGGPQGYPSGAPQQWGAPPQQMGGQGQWGAPPQGQWGGPPQQQGQWGAPPQQIGGQYGAPPAAGGYDASSNWGASGGTPGGPPQCIRPPTTRTDPVQQEVASPPNTPHLELQRVIAAEYNKSPDAQRAGDRISSGNVEIQNVAPSGSGCMVTFCVNDGEYTPDAGERGMLKWIILGGIASGVAYKILGRRGGGGGGWGKSFF